jgi:type II secretory pathway component GspD/PulD (secretin)
MNARTESPLLRKLVPLALVLAAGVVTSARLASAADHTFVGIVALAVEKDVAQEIGLSEEEWTNLLRFCDKREIEALRIAIGVPREEQAAKLAPFVAESERIGLAMLTDEQKLRLQQIRISRAGMGTLTEEAIAAQLKLTDEQKAEIERLLAERDEKLAGLDEDAQRAMYDEYERKLRGVLDNMQVMGWDLLAGIGAPAQVAAADQPAEDKPAEDKPAEEKPAEAKPEEAKPATVAEEKPAEAPAAVDNPEDVKIRFNYAFTPWEDVIKEYAKRCGLAVLSENFPPGTLNYQDPREYTATGALDRINSILWTKGFTLIRDEKMLMVLNLEDEIPLGIIKETPLANLDEIGTHEIAQVLFPLRRLAAADAKTGIDAMKSPIGNCIVLTPFQILVTETGGNLLIIRKMIEEAENPTEAASDVVVVNLQNASAEEAMAAIRPLVGIEDPEDLTNRDRTVSLAPDLVLSRIYVSGTPQMIDKVKKIAELVDLGGAVENGVPLPQPELPQLEVYQLKSDPATAKAVVDQLIAGNLGVRSTLDPLTNNLIILASPTVHATVKATLAQLEAEQVIVKKIKLYRMDPTEALAYLTRMMSIDEASTAPNATKLIGNPSTMELIVRGSPADVAHAENLMAVADPEPGAEGALERSKFRSIPLTGRQAMAVIEQAEAIWNQTGQPNRIRIVPLHPDQPLDQPRRVLPPGSTNRQPANGQPTNGQPTNGQPAAGQPSGQQPGQQPGGEQPAPQATGDKAAAAPSRVPARLIAERTVRRVSLERRPITYAQLAQLSDAADVPQQQPAPPAAEPAAPAEAEQQAPQQADGAPRPEIIVQVGPTGITLISNDLDALDEYEALIRSLMGQAGGAPLPTIFYLKYAKADYAAELLTQILGGVSTSSSTGGDNLLTGVTSAVLGDTLGGLVPGLLGGSGSVVGSGTQSIVAVPHINALVVQAAPLDMELIEIMLERIDQEESETPVETDGTPRIIPVFNVSADEIANVVRALYPEQLSSGSQGGGGGRQQQGFEELVRAFAQGRGGGGGNTGRGGRGGQEQQVPKMRLTVDTRTNALLVAAPTPLFNEVEALVRKLDDNAMQQAEETTQVIALRRSNPQVIQSALTKMFGSQITSSGTSSTQQNDNNGGDNRSSQERDQVRQAFEAFNSSRGGFGGFNRDGGGFGGFNRGGDGGGFSRGGDGGRGSFGGGNFGGGSSGRGSFGGGSSGRGSFGGGSSGRGSFGGGSSGRGGR